MTDKTDELSRADMKIKRMKEEFVLKLECYELEKVIMQNDIKKLKLKLQLVEKEKQLALHQKNSKLQDQMIEIDRLKSELRKSQSELRKSLELDARKSKKSRNRPTHFLAIKITRPELLANLKTKQKEIRKMIKSLGKKHRLGKRGRAINWERALVPPEKFHITLNMLCLQTEESVESAKQILKEFDRRKLDELFGPIKGVEISGMEHFDEQVLFAKVKHPAPLQNLFNYLRDLFKDFRMEDNDKSLKPHVTIMKTSRAKKLRTLAPILKTLALTDNWVTCYQPFEKLQLCSMREKEEVDDGYYFVEEEVPLTIEIENSPNESSNDTAEYKAETGEIAKDQVDSESQSTAPEEEVSSKAGYEKDEALKTNGGGSKELEAPRKENSNTISETAAKKRASVDIPRASKTSSEQELEVSNKSNVNSPTSGRTKTNVADSRGTTTSDCKEKSDEEAPQQSEDISKTLEAIKKLIQPESPEKPESKKSGKELKEQKISNSNICASTKQVKQQQSIETSSAIAVRQEQSLENDLDVGLGHMKKAATSKNSTNSSEITVGSSSTSEGLNVEELSIQRKVQKQRLRRRNRQRVKKGGVSNQKIKTKYCPNTGVKILDT